MLETIKSASVEDRLAGANVAMAVVAAASLLSKGIKAQAAALLEGVDPAIVREASETMNTPVALINNLVRVMGKAASDHLPTLKP